MPEPKAINTLAVAWQYRMADKGAGMYVTEVVNSAGGPGVAWHYRVGDYAAGTLICPGGCTRTEACTSIEERHGRRVTEIICAGRP